MTAPCGRFGSAAPGMWHLKRPWAVLDVVAAITFAANQGLAAAGAKAESPYSTAPPRVPAWSVVHCSGHTFNDTNGGTLRTPYVGNAGSV